MGGTQESMFMFVNSFIHIDHATNKLRIVALCSLQGEVAKNYSLSLARIDDLRRRLAQPAVQFIDSDPKRYDHCSRWCREPTTISHNVYRYEGISNVGKEGYEGMVRKLRERIIDGDFIQVSAFLTFIALSKLTASFVRLFLRSA